MSRSCAFLLSQVYCIMGQPGIKGALDYGEANTFDDRHNVFFLLLWRFTFITHLNLKKIKFKSQKPII